MTDRAAKPEGSLPLSGALRVDEVCRRFEAAWKAGDRPSVQDYLAGASGRERAALLRELIGVDVHYRRPAPKAQDYLGPFPDLDPIWLDGMLPADIPGPGPSPSSSPQALRLTLKVTKGPHTGQAFSFTQHDTFIVGRSIRAQFRLRPAKDRDLSVSRFHFMVELNPPLCRLIDIRSHNGTFVNGKEVQTADLKHGDRVRVGNTILQVSIEEPAAEETVDWPGASPIAAPPPSPAPPPTRHNSPRPAESEVCPGCHSEPVEVGVCAACRRKAAVQEQPIPGYLLIRELGRGAMGVVHLAMREAEGALVAIKTIIPAVAASPMHVQRFLREAIILRDLDHPNIVPFRDLGEAGGMLHFAMDYIPGTDAARLLTEKKRLSVRTAVRLVLPLLAALEYAHAKGFVHRDVKPANLLIRMDCKPNKVMAADFGLARVYQASKLSGLTLLGDVGGTVGFMPPEQILNYREAKPASDQYSAAATLYMLLTGQYVHDLSGPIPMQIDQILKREPVPIQRRRSEISPQLGAVIHRALARRVESRYADVSAFRRALAPFGR